MAVCSLVEPSVGRRVHLVELMEDSVRGLVGEVVDDVLRIRSSKQWQLMKRLAE